MEKLASLGLNQQDFKHVVQVCQVASVDLTWHTLHEIQVPANHWTSAPEVRMHQVRDLTRWNDHPNRTAPQAEALLRRSSAAARSEAARVSQLSDLYV